MNQTHKELFERVGLDQKESETYEALLSLGKAGVLKLLPKVSLKRGSLYNALDGLKEKGLVVELLENKKKVWQVESPDKLQTVIKTSEQRLKEAEQSLLATLPTLKSSYNLTFNRPNVRFFEGEEGVRQVLADSLTSKTEIVTYADLESIEKYMSKQNEQYVKERTRRGIKKRGIVADTDFNRKFLQKYSNNVTDSRLVKFAPTNFQTVMQIYDNTVSYLTLSDESIIGVIIEDKNIYQMHAMLFEQHWTKAIPLNLQD